MMVARIMSGEPIGCEVLHSFDDDFEKVRDFTQRGSTKGVVESSGSHTGGYLSTSQAEKLSGTAPEHGSLRGSSQRPQ
jgi:hypothetical protein